MPTVSVIIPCYNAAKYIKAAVFSALGQTFADFEVLFIDDGSTDNSLRVVEGIAENDSRIRCFHIENSGRPAVPRNVGLDNAKGRYVAFLDADDLWLPQALKKMVDFLERNEAGMVYGMAQHFGKTDVYSHNFGVLPLPFKAKTNYPGLKRGNSIPLTTVMITSEVVKKVGQFDEALALKIGEDYDYWLRVAKDFPIGFIPEILTLYRVTGSNTSKDIAEVIKSLKYLYKIHSFEHEKVWIPKKRAKAVYLLRSLLHLPFMRFDWKREMQSITNL